jgi:hypothetical protein
LRERVEQGVGRCRVARETRRRLAPAGKARIEERRDLVPQVVTVMHARGVGLVLDPAEARFFRVRAQLRARNTEKRTQEPHARAFEATDPGHRGNALETRSPQELEEHGLGLIVAVMRERDESPRAAPA